MVSGDSSCFDLFLAAISWHVRQFSGSSRPCYKLAVVWRLWATVSGIIWRLSHRQRSTYSMGFIREDRGGTHCFFSLMVFGGPMLYQPAEA
jgi:hypothetical protein